MVTNQVIFLTGAASGIGYEMATTFAKEGAKVVVSDRLKERAKSAAEQLQKMGHTAIGLKCDVTSEQEIEEAIAKTVAEFGSLHVLINNAGMQHVSPLMNFQLIRSSFLLKLCRLHRLSQ